MLDAHPVQEAGQPGGGEQPGRIGPLGPVLRPGVGLDHGEAPLLGVLAVVPAELEDLRLALRDVLATEPRVDGHCLVHVRVWLWRAASSGGRPLTPLGDATGYELRLSYYRDPVAAVG